MNSDGQKEKVELTLAEERFCHLFVYGDSDYAGQHAICYEEVFGQAENLSVESKKFLSLPHILARVNELARKLQAETETVAIKLQVTETLKAIMKETATAEFIDRFGTVLSPAPLRAVSVNAARALSDLYPIKHVHESKLRIEADGGGVTFNVIVPEATKEEEAG